MKIVYFDRERGGRNSVGHWVTIHKTSSSSQTFEHETEFDARKSIGLAGGSKDPAYQPSGTTGYEATTTKGDN
jgi:hypothetical protein